MSTRQQHSLRANESQDSIDRLRRRKVGPIENHPLESSLSPPAISVYDADAASVDDSLSHRFSEPYIPPPMIDRNAVLCVGFFVFALAMIWPP